MFIVSGPSSSGSQMNTLGRTGSGQTTNDVVDHTNSLDKRTYLPSYVGKVFIINNLLIITRDFYCLFIWLF